MSTDGGPAFPRAYAENAYGDERGMSLRDWFAGQALLGIMSDLSNLSGEVPRYAAARAYAIADAMIAERAK